MTILNGRQVRWSLGGGRIVGSRDSRSAHIHSLRPLPARFSSVSTAELRLGSNRKDRGAIGSVQGKLEEERGSEATTARENAHASLERNSYIAPLQY
jgi:hypothetical protein